MVFSIWSRVPETFIAGHLSIGDFKCQLCMGDVRLPQLQLIGHMAPFARKL